MQRLTWIAAAWLLFALGRMVSQYGNTHAAGGVCSAVAFASVAGALWCCFKALVAWTHGLASSDLNAGAVMAPGQSCDDADDVISRYLEKREDGARPTPAAPPRPDTGGFGRRRV